MAHRHTPSELGAFIPMIAYFDQLVIDAEESADLREKQRAAIAEEENRKSNMLNDRFISNSTFRVQVNDSYDSGFSNVFHNGGTEMVGTYVLVRMFREVRIRKHMLLHVSSKPIAGYKAIKFRWHNKVTHKPDYCPPNLFFTVKPYVDPEGYGYLDDNGREQCFGQGYEWLIPILGLTEKRKTVTAYMKLEVNDAVIDML